MLLVNPHSFHLNAVALPVSICGNISEPQQAHFMKLTLNYRMLYIYNCIYDSERQRVAFAAQMQTE